MLRAMALASPAHGAFLPGPSATVTSTTRTRRAAGTSSKAAGALASVETLLRHQHEAALEALTEVPEPAKEALVGLASMAAERDH